MAELDPQPVELIEPVEAAAVVEAAPTRRPRKVYGGMWGPAEIVVVAAGLLALIGAFAFYLLGAVPSNRELTRNKSEADRLDAEVVSARSKYGDIKSTQDQVGKLVASLDDFETRFLPVQSNGQSALYERLNGLMAAYGLVNTTGPDYAPLEAADITKPGQQQTDEEKGRSKYRSLYPGVYVTTTVEGTYQNLRRFIREIETGREFVLISAIELAPSDTDTQKPQSGPTQASVGQPGVNPNIKGFNQPVPPVAPQQTGPKGKMHGETVALHIEMAAYFRRPNFTPMSEQYQQ
jgi:hypothetical protein